MSEWIERMRGIWDALNERERLLVGALGTMLVLSVLCLPLLFTLSQNSTLEEENAALRSALKLISEHGAELKMRSEARRASEARYTRKTPPLGSFLEGEAQKQGLTIREVTDQPEKAFGNYHRRSVSASINEAGLTGIMNLLSALESSPYPIAMDLIQIEHYQAGDSFRLKLGVVTFDRSASNKDDDSAAEHPKPTGG